MLHPLNMPTPMLNAKSIASPLFFINRFLSFLLFIYTGIITVSYTHLTLPTIA